MYVVFSHVAAEVIKGNHVFDMHYRVPRTQIFFAIIILMFGGTQLVAQTDLGASELNLNRFILAPDRHGLGVIPSAFVDAPATSYLGMGLQIADRLIVQDTGTDVFFPVRSQTRLDLSYAIDIARVLQIQLVVPVVVAQSGEVDPSETQSGLTQPGVSGLSEPMLAFKYRFAGYHESDFNMAFLLRSSLPVASHNDGFIREPGFRIEPSILLSTWRPWIGFNASLGGVFRTKEIAVVDFVLGDQLALDAGLSFGLHEIDIPVALQAYSMNRFGLTGTGQLDDGIESVSSNELGLGLLWDATDRIRLSAGTAWSIRAALATPGSRFYGQLVYQFGGEVNEDPIEEDPDETPVDEPEEKETPIETPIEVEITDTDNDQIPDDEDLCPYEFGSPLTEGCPDYDDDGVADEDDICPKLKGLAIYNGCPRKNS